VTSINNIKSELLKNKQYLQEKYHVSTIGIFGSYARGEQKEGSDIDILVDLRQPIGLDFVILADELESILKQKVDLVSSNAIKPKMMDRLKKEILYV
jgi:uncharacterized protein